MMLVLLVVVMLVLLRIVMLLMLLMLLMVLMVLMVLMLGMLGMLLLALLHGSPRPTECIGGLTACLSFLQQQGDVMRQDTVHLHHKALIQLFEVTDVLHFGQHLAVLVHVGKVAQRQIVSPRAGHELFVEPLQQPRLLL